MLVCCCVMKLFVGFHDFGALGGRIRKDMIQTAHYGQITKKIQLLPWKTSSSVSSFRFQK